MEPFGDKPCFVSFNTAISVPFGSENPFAADEVLKGVRWNKLPCLILEKSIKFKIHGFAPGWTLECRNEAGGLGINGGSGGSTSLRVERGSQCVDVSGVRLGIGTQFGDLFGAVVVKAWVGFGGSWAPGGMRKSA